MLCNNGTLENNRSMEDSRANSGPPYVFIIDLLGEPITGHFCNLLQTTLPKVHLNLEEKTLRKQIDPLLSYAVF